MSVGGVGGEGAPHFRPEEAQDPAGSQSFTLRTFHWKEVLEGVVGDQLPCTPTYADIEQLNRWALEKKFPLIKVSIPCFAHLQEEYTLLSVGCALGWGCGPQVIALKKMALEELQGARVALPGQGTTAHALFNLFCPEPQEKVFCLYHEVETLLKEGRVDAAVVIHELRFVHRCVVIADLGQLWTERYGLPLPLGGLAAKKSCDVSLLERIVSASLAHARQTPHLSLPFILHHAQEKKREVVEQHISLYVNDETTCLSAEGKRAISLLLNRAPATLSVRETAL